MTAGPGALQIGEVGDGAERTVHVGECAVATGRHRRQHGFPGGTGVEAGQDVRSQRATGVHDSGVVREPPPGSEDAVQVVGSQSPPQVRVPRHHGDADRHRHLLTGESRREPGAVPAFVAVCQRALHAGAGAEPVGEHRGHFAVSGQRATGPTGIGQRPGDQHRPTPRRVCGADRRDDPMADLRPPAHQDRRHRRHEGDVVPARHAGGVGAVGRAAEEAQQRDLLHLGQRGGVQAQVGTEAHRQHRGPDAVERRLSRPQVGGQGDRTQQLDHANARGPAFLRHRAMIATRPGAGPEHGPPPTDRGRPSTPPAVTRTSDDEHRERWRPRRRR